MSGHASSATSFVRESAAQVAFVFQSSPRLCSSATCVEERAARAEQLLEAAVAREAANAKSKEVKEIERAAKFEKKAKEGLSIGFHMVFKGAL